MYPGGGTWKKREGLCVPVVGDVSGAVQSSLLDCHCLPLFLFLIHGHSTRPKCHHQKQAANDRGGLEEVILEKVVHGFVGGDGPEGVEVNVDCQKPHDQSQRSQLGFKADCHQDDEGSSHHVLQDL